MISTFDHVKESILKIGCQATRWIAVARLRCGDWAVDTLTLKTLNQALDFAWLWLRSANNSFASDSSHLITIFVVFYCTCLLELHIVVHLFLVGFGMSSSWQRGHPVFWQYICPSFWDVLPFPLLNFASIHTTLLIQETGPPTVPSPSHQTNMKLFIALALLVVTVMAVDPRKPEDICIEYGQQHGHSFERASKYDDCSVHCCCVRGSPDGVACKKWVSHSVQKSGFCKEGRCNVFRL